MAEYVKIASSGDTIRISYNGTHNSRPGQEGLNGSVWVFDTDKGTVLEKYDNVCYRPL